MYNLFKWTDALMMVLMAKEVGPGDAIFLPSFTYTATPEVVAILGATPIFVDVLKPLIIWIPIV